MLLTDVGNVDLCIVRHVARLVDWDGLTCFALVRLGGRGLDQGGHGGSVGRSAVLGRPAVWAGGKMDTKSVKGEGKVLGCPLTGRGRVFSCREGRHPSLTVHRESCGKTEGYKLVLCTAAALER